MKFKLSRATAGLAAAAIALSGVMVVSGSANAAPAWGEYVPVTSIAAPANAAEESEVYNEWHFDPNQGRNVVQERNGLVVPGDERVAVRKGNGNDHSDPARTDLKSQIAEIGAGMSIVASAEHSRIAFQVPVFFGYGDITPNKWQFTTLRKLVSSGPDGLWTTSQAFGPFASNASASLDEFITELPDDARAIAAGFYVDRRTTDVVVSSFTVGGETTGFYEEPVSYTPNGTLTKQFVEASDIRPDEETYPGWHEGVPNATATYETVTGTDGKATGLKVTGKSQLINGFADDAFLQNAVTLGAGLTVEVTPGSSAVFAQLPVFFYPEGVSGKQFTTLRAPVPASGNLADATEWTTSQNILSAGGEIAVAANTSLPTLGDFAAVLGDHEVLGYGFLVDSGSATVRSVAFDNRVAEFFEPATTPPARAPLTDIKPGVKFYKEITWMHNTGLTTGVKQADGSHQFVPKASVSREAIAAFVYRFHGANYVGPAVSPFADVKKGDKFYNEITWMYKEGLTTGVKQASGKPKFLPKSAVTREAMAAFLYRLDGSNYAGSKTSPFSDIAKGQKFYKEITWMEKANLSTGVKQPSGKPHYLPKSNVTREAMAAFLYRFDADS